MRVVLPVASTAVDRRTRAAFSPACLDDIADQLTARVVPVTYEYRDASVAGKTIPGSARRVDLDLVVDVDLSPLWWTADELAKVIDSGTIGGGIAGRMLKESRVDTIHVTDQIRVAAVTLLQLHASVNPDRPAARKA